MKLSKGVSKAIFFIGGVVVGAASSFYFAKKYYQKKSEEEIKSIEEAFTKKINELEDAKESALNAASKALINSNEYNKEDPGSKEFLKNKSTLEGFIQTSSAEREDYTKFFDKNSAETIEVDDHPRDDGEDDEIVHRKDGPYEITYEEYGSKPGWDFKEIYYYVVDGVVVDDEEQFIDNPELLLGDVLQDTGFDSDGTRNIYIRNEAISTDFEVMKIDGSYA